MKRILAASAVLLVITGCSRQPRPWVEFTFLNMSSNTVKLEVQGVPSKSFPPVLHPAPKDMDLHGMTVIVPRKLNIDFITLQWEEAGVRQNKRFTRAEIGAPPSLSTGEIKITYYGNARWEVAFRHREENLGVP